MNRPVDLVPGRQCGTGRLAGSGHAGPRGAGYAGADIGCQGVCMANRLMGITIDCADPARLAAFWSQLLDMEVTGEHGDDTGWATVGSRLDHRPRLTFQQVAGPKTAKVRIHLDVQVDDIATARKQVESLGGRWSGERHHYDEGAAMVMHDPEEHEFCLVQYYR